jgi:hypothetical protein
MMPKTMSEEHRQKMAARFKTIRASNKQPQSTSIRYIKTIDSDLLAEKGTIPTPQLLAQLSRNVARIPRA